MSCTRDQIAGNIIAALLFLVAASGLVEQDETVYQPIEERGTVTIGPHGTESETETYSMGPENFGPGGIEEINETINMKQANPPAKPKASPGPAKDSPAEKKQKREAPSALNLHALGSASMQQPAVIARDIQHTGLCTGCPKAGNPLAKDVQAAARAGVSLLNQQRPKEGLVELMKVLTVTKKVVAGILYSLHLQLAHSECKSTHPPSSSDPCHSRTGPPYRELVHVWDEPWRKPRYKLELARNEEKVVAKNDAKPDTASKGAQREAAKEQRGRPEDAEEDQETHNTKQQNQKISKMDPETDEEASQSKEISPFEQNAKTPAHVVENKAVQLSVAATGGKTYHSPVLKIVMLVILGVSCILVLLVTVLYFTCAHSKASVSVEKCQSKDSGQGEDEPLTQPITSDDDIV